MHLDLNTIWFILVGMLFTGYAMLDGFDLGIGALHLFTNKDEERRVMLNAIGPVWDGNEVWLVTGGGALFAAFPDVYATVFSGFYLAFYLLLAALIFRGGRDRIPQQTPDELVAANVGRQLFRRQHPSPACSSALPSATSPGACRLTANGEFAGTFLGLLKPYPLLVGVTTVALFMMHGAIYGVMKTEGDFTTNCAYGR